MAKSICLFRFAAFLFSIAILLSFCACSSSKKEPQEETTDKPSEIVSVSDSPSSSNTPTVSETVIETVVSAPTAVITDATQAPTVPTVAETTAGVVLPQTTAEVLAKYDELMSAFKTDLDAKKLTCMRKEYQEISDVDFGAASSIAQGIVDQMVTPADKAVPEKLTDSSAVPPLDSDGCALEDTNFIKSGTAVDNGDGTATLTLVLMDEKNPQPPEGGVHTSQTGKLFSPMKTTEITDKITKFPLVGNALETFDLNYHDCTATLIYEKNTGSVRSLEQIMRIDLNAHISVLSGLDLSAKVTNHLEITDITSA